MIRMRAWIAVFGTLAAIAFAAAASSGPRTDPRTALHEGNRLFRDGQIDDAVAAYLEGYSPASPHPTLCYNLGTALHHLDRLPEAILWYRRAAGGGSPRGGGYGSRLWGATDPWLEENLWLARRSLGNRIQPPGGTSSWLVANTGHARAAAIAIAWITLLLVVARAAIPLWPVIAAALLAVAVYGGAAAVERWGPQPAVILEDCVTGAAGLAAGTEVWGRPAPGGWRISGPADATCPLGAVEPVFER